MDYNGADSGQPVSPQIVQATRPGMTFGKECARALTPLLHV